MECGRPKPRNLDFDAQPPGGLRIRVPGHVRPLLTKHLTCQSLHCGRGYPQGGLAAGENKSCDIEARHAHKSGGAAAGLRYQSSPFLRHFRFRIAARLKLRHPFEASAKDADLSGQPCRRLTHWSSARCLAGSNAKNAYELDREWRPLDHLAPARGTDNIDLRNQYRTSRAHHGGCRFGARRD